MASSFEFVGATARSRNITFAERYTRRLDEARTSFSLVQDLLSESDHSINQAIEKYGLNRNVIILRLQTLACTAAQVGSLVLDSNKNDHSVLIDLQSGRYSFGDITRYYKINRNDMIMCLADVARETIGAANAKGCSNEQLFRIMAYNNRGDGMSIARSIAKVKEEDGPKSERKRSVTRAADHDWVVV